MGVMEDMNREDHETDNKGNNVEEVGDNGMHRAPSVDDLFAPLSGLNVHASGETRQFRAPEAPSVTKHLSASPSAVPTQFVGPKSEQGSAATQVGSGSPATAPLPSSQSSVSSSAAREAGELSKNPETKLFVPSEKGSQQQGASGKVSESANKLGGNSASHPTSQFNVNDAADIDPSLFSSGSLSAHLGGSGGAVPASKLHSGKGWPDAALPPSQSTSDDEQLTGAALDERKQKRMLSNRESARRSRLRKQQHLDELRAQVAHLRAENTDMMARYGIASQRYSQITNENVVLRAHAVDLTGKLHQVHHALATNHPNGLRSLGIEAGRIDHFTAGDPTSYVQSLGTDLGQ